MNRPFNHPRSAIAPNADISAASRVPLVIADASKVSGRDFLDAITGRSPAIRAAEREQMLRQCIRAIERGDVFGFPPAIVAECREIMASEDCGWLLAERVAFGMGEKL